MKDYSLPAIKIITKEGITICAIAGKVTVLNEKQNPIAINLTILKQNPNFKL